MNKKMLLGAAAMLFAAGTVSAAEMDFANGGFNMKKAIENSGMKVPAAAAAESLDRARSGQAEWTIMVFVNGKNNLEKFALRDVNEMEMIGSTDKVNIVVELGRMAGFDSSDGDWKGVRRYLIKKDNDTSKITSPVVQDLGKKDMGDYKSAIDFGKWAKANYPAKKYMFIFWNHGAGWIKSKGIYSAKGISYDDETNNHMDTPQMAKVLKEIGGVTVVGSDACLMQMASVAYEFKDYAKVIVGSEQPIPGAGYPYKGFMKMLAMRGSQIDAAAFGKILVGGYGTQYRNKSNITLSAIDSSKLPGFISRLNSWAGLMMSDKESFKIISKANVLKEVTRMDSLDSSRDLVHMIHTINKQDGVSQRIKDAGNALEDYVTNNLVIANYASETEENFGLAIYLPDLRYEANPYETLQFSADSRWSEFIKKVLQSRLDNGW